MKSFFLALCMIAGASALVPWASNPILPGYPIFFVGWNSEPYCDTVNKAEKQCFEDCMNGNGMGQQIGVANSIAPACPPNIQSQYGCYPEWKTIACRCAKRCECRLGKCNNQDNCPFCRGACPT